MNKRLILLFYLSALVSANTLKADNDNVKHNICAECHGDKGTNKDLSGPNLAGQNSLYLLKQINSFTQGERSHPLLSSNAFKIDQRKLTDLVNYYSDQKPENPATESIQEGELMFSSCTACHGANGEGIALFPRLSGQKPDYIQQQLINFKTGVRKSTVMQMMSINLSDEEIKLLATYISSLQSYDSITASEMDSSEASMERR